MRYTENKASRVPSLVPNLFWGNDLVGELVLQHAVLMDATLMCIGIGAHNSLQYNTELVCKSSNLLWTEFLSKAFAPAAIMARPVCFGTENMRDIWTS